MPPLIRPFNCSVYASTSSSNLTALYPGSFTSGEIEAVLFKGPKDPATNRGLLGVFFENLSAALFAILAEARFSSYTLFSSL